MKDGSDMIRIQTLKQVFGWVIDIDWTIVYLLLDQRTQVVWSDEKAVERPYVGTLAFNELEILDDRHGIPPADDQRARLDAAENGLTSCSRPLQSSDRSTSRQFQPRESSTTADIAVCKITDPLRAI